MKKIISSLLLFAVIFTAFLPSAGAVQFAGEDVNNIEYRTLKLPGVATKKGKSIYTFDKNADSNGINSMLCISGEEVDGSCSTYLGTITPFFVFDRTNFKNANIKYYIADHTLEFRMFDHSYDDQYEEGYVYFTYDVKNNSGYSSKGGGAIAKVKKDEACGTQNSNICVIGIHTYLYFVSASGIQGVYMAMNDLLKYSGPDDNMVFIRKYYDAGSHFNNRNLYDSIMGFFNKYKGSYGKLLFDFNYTNPVFYLKEDGEYSYIYFDRNKVDTGGTFRKKKGEYMQGAPSPNIKSGYKFEEDGSAAYAIRLASYDAYKTVGPDNTYIRDFFVGNNQDLVFNLKDYFGAVDINDEIAGKDASSNPDNWTFDKCENTDIGCNIKALGSTISQFFTSIIDGIKGIFTNIWDGFLDVIKSVFYWFWDLVKPIVEPIYNFFNGILIFFQKNIEDLSKISFTGSIDTCKEYDDNISSSGTTIAKNLTNFISLAIPFAPADETQICTLNGKKIVDYKDNTKFLDTIFVLVSFMSIIFTFISGNSRNA